MSLLFSLLLVASLTGGADSTAVHHRAGATIQGTITMKPAAPRRVANRYVGVATPSARQTSPLIVFLRGAGLPAARPAAQPPRMAQQDTMFAPSHVVVPRGTAVAFQNRDPFFHNVFSYSKTKRFDLGRFPAPEAKTIVFDKVGAVDVFCEIHRSMRGVILVVDNDYHTRVAQDGTYELRDVPAGRYELVVWQADKGEKVIPVTVPAAGSITVNASL